VQMLDSIEASEGIVSFGWALSREGRGRYQHTFKSLYREKARSGRIHARTENGLS
jgi:hypothetical protein